MNLADVCAKGKAEYLASPHGWRRPWVELLVDPVVDAIAQHLETRVYYRATAPQGLGARVYAAFFKPGTSLEGSWEEREAAVLCRLDFEPMDLQKAEIGVVDYTKVVVDYPANSIGALNRLQYCPIPLPETVAELAEIGRVVRKEG